VTSDGLRPAQSPVEVTLAYHERTKHWPHRFARSLGYMDWATQPDPFRRFEGAPALPLDLVPVEPEPGYEAALAGRVAPAPLDRRSISQLFQDALGLSAWKQAGYSTRWSLRMNPSSGNLHPTEGHLVAGPVHGLHARPAVYHYAPFVHGLERRVDLSGPAWSELVATLPAGSILVGLSSIHWRESWKYGERAFRYCQHDVGHAIGSLAVAAAGLGWETRLLEAVPDRELAALLGVDVQDSAEAEHADLLLAVFPRGSALRLDEECLLRLGARLLTELREARWSGSPNRLSDTHHEWSVIDDVARATQKTSPPSETFWSTAASGEGTSPHEIGRALRTIVHRRRSAVELDGRTSLSRAGFYEVLSRVLPVRPVPFAALPWRPRVDLLLFVHRVAGLDPGLYALVRDESRRAVLAQELKRSFAWSRPAGCPAELPLFLLEAGDARTAARQTSCGQDIAADGAFAAAMLAEYRDPLEEYGAWFYRRLHWETGAIGQMLYLEAEAQGIRATGIGCFFDDLTHELFGLRGNRYQVLYHFTMGGPLEDERLQTHPPYAHLDAGRA